MKFKFTAQVDLFIFFLSNLFCLFHITGATSVPTASSSFEQPPAKVLKRLESTEEACDSDGDCNVSVPLSREDFVVAEHNLIHNWVRLDLA